MREYIGGWEATLSLLRQGRSWSGFERNCLFLNEGSFNEGGGPFPRPHFADVSAPSGLDFPDDGRGLVVVDWDHDGDLDLWLSNRTGPRLRLMLNQTRQDGVGPSFVDIALRGRRSNRDAIGARVELSFTDPARRPMIQTVYAGDGFLSQSSKRLLFGLGSKPEGLGLEPDGALLDIVTVVRWPDGRRESFSGIRPDRRYVLEEGRGVAVREEPRPRVALAPTASPDPPQAANTNARAFLPSPVPLPVLRHETLAEGALAQPDARRLEVEAVEQRPLLLNLWASWCIPCRGELEEWTEHEHELRGAGLDVLALTVDGLSSDQVTTPQDARRFVEQIHFPFATGIATTELLEKLELLQQTIFDRHRASAVPTSFLIDRQQRLAAVYRGRVDRRVLLGDVRNLEAPTLERQALAAPLGGRWLRPLPEIDPRHLARVFRERYPEDAERFLSLALDAEVASRGGAGAAPAAEANAEQAEIHFGLAEALYAQGRHEEATVALREALRSRPDFPRAHNNLGVALRSEGRNEEAISHFREALASEPTFAEASYNLGLALTADSRMEEAVAALRAAIELRQDYAEAHHALSAALLRLGQTGNAVQHLEETVRLQPEWPTPLNTLARLLSSHPDPEIRRGVVAIDLAERAANLTGHRHPGVLDTLAMAYAEAGRFEEAVVVSRQAISVAASGGAEDLAAEIRAHLSRYERGEPFRESNDGEAGHRQ